MKISRLEFVALLLAAVFAAFAAGWFFRGQAAPQPVRVETERTLTQETPLALPAPTPSPSAQSEDIIAYRRANGPFRIPEELTEVPGIGEGILEGLIDYVTTGEENR